MSAAVPADSAVDFALSRPPPPQRGPSAAPGALRASLYASRLYRLTLLGSAPAGLAVHPPDPWPGDAATGDRLFQGRYRFAGHEVTSLARPIWLPPRIDAAWLEAMHGFDWLRHFKAAGGEAARRHARTLVADWIRHCGRWRPGVWDAAVVGRRVTAWIAAAGFLLHGADLRWRTAFFASLAVQERHLARVARREATGARRVAALSGLLHARVCLGRGNRRIRRAVDMIVRECGRQILPDGGHVDRSPARHCGVLADLAGCRALLAAAGRTAPAPLNAAVERMASVLRALCHGDGGLAAFNDSGENAVPDAAAVLHAAGATAKPLVSARDMGFQRLAAGRSVLIVDTGRAAGTTADHAGTTAFEMSVGPHRLIVNCGPHTGRDAAWAEALRCTAAHSTLVLADTSLDPAAPVECVRRGGDGATWLDMVQHGYARRFGFVHQRRLYLAASGTDVRGEDILSPAPDAAPKGPQPFAVRFHLHPTVTASLEASGRTALLRLADGTVWRMLVSGGSLAINLSVYFADGFTCRHNEQAVIAGVSGLSGVTVKWSLKRVGGP